MITYSKTGTYHLSAGTGCQDALLFRDTPEYRFLALADGASGCENSRLGAEVACRAAADYYLTYGSTLKSCADEKAAYLILDQIRFCLEEAAAEQDVAPDSLSSTLTFCCIHKKRREMTVFHLGDGAVYALNPGQAEALVHPAGSRGAPPLTMTINAHKRAQIHRFPLSPESHVLICSDGLLKVLDSDNAQGIRSCLSGRDYPALTRLLDESQPFDDCSFIVC